MNGVDYSCKKLNKLLKVNKFDLFQNRFLERRILWEDNGHSSKNQD
jgi:hypothetical protein